MALESDSLTRDISESDPIAFFIPDSQISYVPRSKELGRMERLIGFRIQHAFLDAYS